MKWKCEISINYKFLAYLFQIQGRDSYRLDPATSIQGTKYAVYRTLRLMDCVLLSFFRRSILVVRRLKNLKKIKNKLLKVLV